MPHPLDLAWRRRPDRFCRDFLGLEPWARQRDALLALARSPRVTVRSGHGVGKSAVAAASVVWFLMLHDPAIVLTTAPTARQVEQVLWREIRRLLGACPFLRAAGHLNRTEWRLGPQRFALGLSTNESDRFQGFHSPNILVVIDEAAGVDSEIYEAVLGVVTSENARLMLIGNPTTPSGFFYDSHRPGSGFERLHISSEESPNVVAGREIVPGLVTRRWIEERREEWGADSPVYRARVLGEFPENAVNALLTLSAIDAARRLVLPPEGPAVIGVDVARYGDDRSVLVARRGGAIVETVSVQGEDVMSLTGRVVDLARRIGAADADIRVDDCGVGGGVVDRLRELGRKVAGVNAASAAWDPDLYANVRAEMWRRMADAVARGELSLRGAPERLAADLAAPTYSFTSRGQMKLEDKADIKRRLGRSPDHGDALALTYAAAGGGPSVWIA